MPRRSSCRPSIACWSLLALAPLAEVAAADDFVRISAECPLASNPGRIRQHAFDGKAETYYESEGAAGPADTFTLKFSEKVPVKKIKVETGRPGGDGALPSGVVEVSEDGEAFEEAGKIENGVGEVVFADRSLRAVRVKPPQQAQTAPLVIREFAIDSPRVRPFQHPVEFVVNTTDAPEMQEWTVQTARLCEEWYDFLNDALSSPDYKPADRITLTMRPSYRGVAEAGGNRITGSVRFFKQHPEDRGAFIHETVHVIQRYRDRKNPGWLVEGVADYVRFFQFEPGKAGPVNPRQAKYDGSYRTTATFLDYVARTYDKQIVPKLNRAMREGNYDEAIFKEATGKPLAELGEEWKESLKK